ncbi:MAG: thiol:disulfide interchange protein, partial [Bacteroidia bacterium]|nr:thiol:disulfide interchange protein [Bacteroidia bacterium]
LSDKIESAELYFLSLDKIPGKQLSFFGEQGTITINTKLDKFVLGATINGLTNQQLLDEYNAMKSQFTNKRLELIKEDFEAKQSQDSHIIDSIENQIENLIKKRYYYTANFAITHADSEIAPYLALTELFDANIKLLDTINISLSPEVKASKYGKQLDQYIKDIKNNE